MPHYEYFCEDCQKSFDKLLTFNEHEHEEQTVVCPFCGGHHVYQMVSAFYAVTSKKS